MVGVMYAAPSEEHLFDQIGRVGIGQISQRGRVEELQAGALAACDAAVRIADAHAAGGVDGGGVDGFLGCQPHLDAGQGDDELHVARWR